jgi:diaminopimelate decarboxylase
MTYTARRHFSEHIWVDERDHLRIERRDALDLAHEFGTPLFVLSDAQIRANVARFQAAFRAGYPNTDVFFATKANYGLAVRAAFTAAGAGGDAFGPVELYVNLLVGTPPHMLALNGSNKGEPEIELAITAGVPIHVDDPAELDVVIACADRLGRPAQVSPRTRLLLHALDEMEADWPRGVRVGPGARAGNKFGMHYEDTERVCRRVLADPRLRLVGMHHHVGRWNHQLAVYDAVVREQVAWAARLREALAWTPEYLDFGGGMAEQRDEGIGPFGLDRDAPAIEAYAATITEALREELDRFGLPHPRLIVEPGRSIAGNIAVLLARVGVVKTFPGVKTWVSLDASQNLMPNIVNLAYQYHAIAADRATAPTADPVDLVGPLCSFDFLGHDRRLPVLRRGDVVAFLDTGAYCESKAVQFNALPRPASVMVSGEHVDVVVERETLQDVIARHRLPARLLTPRANLPGSVTPPPTAVGRPTSPVSA